MSNSAEPTNSPDETPQPAPLDRFLSLGALGIVVLAIVCFLAIIVGTWLGNMTQEDFQSGFWPVVSAIPLYGLPIAFVMLLVVIFRGFARNGRKK